MSEENPKPRGRRSQAERSAHARSKILAATIRLLHEGGYSAANVKPIARAAGMSLGSVQHHYPTKAKLMAAVVNELARRRLAVYRDALRGIADPARRLAAMVDATWTVVQRPEFMAVLEIMLARRSDADLERETGPAFARHERRLNRWLLSLGAAAGQDLAGLDLRRRMSTTLMYGFAVRLTLGMERWEAEAIIDYWRAVLRLMIDHPDTAPDVEGLRARYAASPPSA